MAGWGADQSIYTRLNLALISTMLDAHPNAIVADEEDAPWHISAGFTHDQLYSQLLHRSSQQARSRRVKVWLEGMERIGGPNYLVPGQWQGRFERLYVIGDNRAGKTVQQLAQNPQPAGSATRSPARCALERSARRNGAGTD